MTEEKRYNGAEVMSNISGIPKPEIMAMWEAAKANNVALNVCAGPHDFVPSGERCGFGEKQQCRLCGGSVGPNEAHWYFLGRAHEAASRALGGAE